MKLDLEVVVVANECYDILLNGCTKLQRIFLFSIINSMDGSKGLVVDIKKKEKKKFYTYLNLPLGYIAFKNNFSLTFFKQSFFFFGSYLLLCFFFIFLFLIF